jgi:hypothetical protein
MGPWESGLGFIDLYSFIWKMRIRVSWTLSSGHGTLPLLNYCHRRKSQIYYIYIIYIHIYIIYYIYNIYTHIYNIYTHIYNIYTHIYYIYKYIYNIYMMYIWFLTYVRKLNMMKQCRRKKSGIPEAIWPWSWLK